MEIVVNAATCIRCGHCADACPSRIFTQARANEEIRLENTESCIVCGHCAAVCPVGAVEHPDFTEGKVHPVDYGRMPSPEQVMTLINARRSNRAFSGRPIPEASLTAIVEAAHRAPTASNMQQVSFTLVASPDGLKAVSAFTIGVFAGVKKLLSNPLLRPVLKPLMPGLYRMIPAFERLQACWNQGDDLILRRATAVLLIHTPSKSRFGAEDANLAYQNASLMAEALGVAHFYTGFVLAATRQKKGKLESELGIEGTIRAGMAMAMPKFRYPNYIDKKDAKINAI